MRPTAEYVALRDIQLPDSYAYAARAGHDVTEMQRVNLNLVVGVDILPLTNTVMQRPDDDADRRQWQDYSVVRGVPYEEAVNLDRAELVKRVEAADKQKAEPVSAGLMPAENEPKARWSEYAALEILRRTGGSVTLDEARERVAPLRKADLVETFGPDASPGADAELIATPDRAAPAAAMTPAPGHSADPVADQGNPESEK